MFLHRNAKWITAISGVLFIPISSTAQVTRGKKPDLPQPFATKSAGNGPNKSQAPQGFLPTVPAGFHVNIFASDFKNPRLLTVAPNGDIFLANTGADEVVILRDPKHTGGAQERVVFSSNVRRPFGIVFHGDYVYIGNMTSVVRFKYDPKTSQRLGEAEVHVRVNAAIVVGGLVQSGDERSGPAVSHERSPRPVTRLGDIAAG